MGSKHAEYLDAVLGYKHAADYEYNVAPGVTTSTDQYEQIAPTEEPILPGFENIQFKRPQEEEEAILPGLENVQFKKPQEQLTQQQQPLQPGDKVVEPTEEELISGAPLFGEEPEEVGDIVYSFIPEFPDTLSMAYSNTDVSFDSILYLHSLGYKYAQWQLSSYRGRILYDICDVYNGRFFTLDTLLNDARNHAAGGSTPGNWKSHKPYYPPAPIFSESHPGCGCSLICLKPRSISEIPNTAPGVPQTSNQKIINDARRRILDSLQDELVNHHTFIDTAKAQQLQLQSLAFSLAQAEKYKGKGLTSEVPDEAKKYQRNRHVRKWTPTYQFGNVQELSYPETQEPSEASHMEAQASFLPRTKFAASVNIPVVLTDSIMYASKNGLITPIARGYRGFIIDKGEEASRVYIVQLNHTIELPNDILQELKLRPSKYDPHKIYGGVYIYADDMLGITFKVYGDKEKSTYALVYIPELNDLVEVHSWVPLEMI